MPIPFLALYFLLSSLILPAFSQEVTPPLIIDHGNMRPSRTNAWMRTYVDEDGRYFQFHEKQGTLTIHRKNLSFLSQKVIKMPDTPNCRSDSGKYYVNSISITPDDNLWIITSCLYYSLGKMDHQAILMDNNGNILKNYLTVGPSRTFPPVGDKTFADGALHVVKILAHDDGGYYLIGKDTASYKNYIIRRYDPNNNIIWGKSIPAGDDVLSIAPSPPSMAKGVVVFVETNINPETYALHRFSENGELLSINDLNFGERNWKQIYRYFYFNEFGLSLIFSNDGISHYLQRFSISGELLYQRLIPAPASVAESKKSSHFGGINFSPQVFIPGIDDTTLIGYLNTYHDQSGKFRLIDGRLLLHRKDFKTPLTREISVEIPSDESLCRFAELQSDHSIGGISKFNGFSKRYGYFKFRFGAWINYPRKCGEENATTNLAEILINTDLRN